VYGDNGNILRSRITFYDQIKFSSIEVTDIRNTKATISGELLSSIDDLNVILELRKLDSNLVEVEYGKVNAGNESLELLLSNLEENSTYNCRFKVQALDEVIYSDQITFTTSPILSFQDKRDGFIIYPSPAKNYIQIKGISSLSESVLFNMNGQIVKKESVNPNFIDVSGLSPGTYILRLNGQDLQIFKRIIKR